MLHIALSAMAGLWMTFLTKPPMISLRMIFAVPVSFSCPVATTCDSLISVITVPKFQGENFYNNKKIVEEIKRLAARKGCTLTQVALAWVAAQGLIAIPGTTKPSRLEENFASREIDLTENEKKEMRNILDSFKPHGNRYNDKAQAMVGH
jgi:hypothetical protein